MSLLYKLRRRAQDEQGFTLIELLVVILIIGILAAIAIPSFLNQKTKANDASAKELARTGETVAETYATDNNGLYTNMTPAVLGGTTGLEPTIQIAAGNNNAYLSIAAPDTTNKGYTVTAVATDGNTFSITRGDTGTITRSCTPTTTGASSGGCVAGTW
jgi:type IV pilus assembly protein PilA